MSQKGRCKFLTKLTLPNFVYWIKWSIGGKPLIITPQHFKNDVVSLQQSARNGKMYGVVFGEGQIFRENGNITTAGAGLRERIMVVRYI